MSGRRSAFSRVCGYRLRFRGYPLHDSCSTRRPDRRLDRWVLVAIGAGLLLATSDHLVDPIACGLQRGRDGRGMVQRGALLAGSTPWQSTRSLPSRAGGRHRPRSRFRERPSRFSAASVCWPIRPSVLLVFYVLFAFPEGRIASRFAWALLGAMSLSILESTSPGSSSRRSSMALIPLADCDPACPANGFMIADRPTLADGFLSEDFLAYYLLAAFSAFFVYLIYRLATATRPRRRALLPVYVPALLALVPVVVYYAVFVELVHVDASTLSDVGLADQHRLRRTAIRISAFDRGEHVLRRDGVENDRLPPGREPERRSAAHDAGRCTR